MPNFKELIKLFKLYINILIFQVKSKKKRLGVMEHAYHPSTWVVEVGRSRLPGQPGLHNRILPLKTKIK